MNEMKCGCTMQVVSMKLDRLLPLDVWSLEKRAVLLVLV